MVGYWIQCERLDGTKLNFATLGSVSMLRTVCGKAMDSGWTIAGVEQLNDHDIAELGGIRSLMNHEQVEMLMRY